MKRVFGIAFLLVVLAGTASANEAIWREGEAATATTFNHHGWFENDPSIKKSLMSPGVPEGAAGNWFAHYTSANLPAYCDYTIPVAEGGNYTWWARIAPTNTSYTYSIDSAPAQNVDMSHQHEVLDIIRPGINDVHYLGWVRIGTFPLSVGTHTARLTAVYNAAHATTIGGIDAVVFVNYAWTPTGAKQPTGAINPDPTPGPTVWFPLHVAEDAFSAQSIIDLRSLVDAATGIPAGKYGNLTRVLDQFEMSGRPGTPVKFWGVTATHPGYTASFDTQARFYVKHGVNLVRRHPMISEIGEAQNAAALDIYDRWFKALKDNGVYTNWSVFYPDNVAVSRSFLPTTPADANFVALLGRAGITLDELWNELPASGTNRFLGGMDNFVEWYEEGSWQWLSALLQHTNPYTGLQYVNDPALAIVEVQNEDSIFFHWPLNTLAVGTVHPRHTLLLRRMWFEWLGTRYADDAALKAAWGTGWRTGDSVVTFNASMKIYGAWEMYAPGPFNAANEKARCGDWIRFLAETQRAHYQARFDNMRTLGYQGVVASTGWHVGGPATAAANAWTDDAGDAIDHHAYMGGSAGGYRVIVGSVSNDIQLANPGAQILAADIIGTGANGGTPNESVYQVEDKPAIMTEWDDSCPTQWRGEISPLFAFYGMGLQGWDASLHFAGSYPWMETGWPGTGTGPGMYVTETPLYMAQYPALALAIYKGHIQQGALVAARRMSVDDLFRGVDPLSQTLPNGGYPGSPNMYTPGEVNAIGRVTLKADAALSSANSAKVNWNTYWDQANKIITSTTGELVWDYNSRYVQVKSPKTQAVIGWASGQNLNLGAVTVNATTPFVSLIFTSLDDLPLTDSVNILVTALAQDTETGAVYGGGGTSLTAVGGPPLLLQPVQASITMGGLPVTSVRVVDVYGVPTSQTVPVAANAFTIDGSYTTYYYQIRRNQTPTPNIGLSIVSLNTSCVQGASPVNDTFQVWNSGTAPLNYTLSDDAAWLAVSPGSGTSTDSTNKVIHTVTYSASGLPAGNYNATITITDPTATNNPQTISVTLTVNTPPSIVCDTTVLNPVVTVGNNAISQSFKVWDGGEVVLSYTVADSDNWLGANPASASSTGVADKKTHTVSYSTAGLAIGAHDATITIASVDATNTPQTIAVHLTVQPTPPLISRSPVSLAPSCIHGANAAAQTFDVWNSVTGGSPLSYTISEDSAWLSLTPDSGSSTDPTDQKTHTVTYSTAGLGIGTHNATITVSAVGAANSPQMIAVQLTVAPAPPAITRTPTSLSPQCAQTTNAPSQSFLVWNSSDQTLNYTISDDAGWLSVGPASGASTGVGDKQTHTVTYATAGLAQGDWYATITITDAAASNSPQTIPVHLAVLSAPPAISASPVSFTPSCLAGENAASQSIDIWNSGEGRLDYTAFVSTLDGPPGWVAVSPGSGSSTGVGNKQTHSIIYTTAAMAAGIYHANVVVSSAYASNTPQSYLVTLTISAPGSIGLDKTSMSPSVLTGVNPAAEPFQVWNAGTGTMGYTVSDDVNWLSVGPASGSSTGVGDIHAHTVTYAAGDLGVGIHTANISITGAGINNAPRTVQVQLNVSAAPALQITYPQASDSPLGDALVTVTGTVGVPGSVQALWVNGVLATDTGAGFSTWEATIPLNQGWGIGGASSNTITVSTLDSAGNYNANAASVNVDSIGGAGLVRHTGLAMTANGAVVPGDMDIFQFDAAAGTSLTLTAKGTGTPLPNLMVELYDNYSDTLLTRTGSNISISSLPPGNGLYMVCVSAASGNGGRYTLKLTGKAPSLKMTTNGTLTNPGSLFDHTMSIPRGSLLTTTVSSTKFQPTLQVFDPIGDLVPLAGYVTTTVGKVALKNLPISSGPESYLPGEYTLRVASGDGRFGAFTLTCAGLAPTPVANLVNDPLLLSTSPKSGVRPGAQLQLSVSGGSVAPSLNWVYLIPSGGGPPWRQVVSSTSLVNGKGSIYVTVHPAVPVGPAQVYFVDLITYEKSNMVTVQILP